MVAGGASRVVAAMARALGVVRLQILLRLHLRHGSLLALEHGGDVDERRRREVAQLGLMGLEEEERRRLDRRKGAAHTRARRQSPRAVHRRMRDGVVRVERVRVRVRDQHIGRELADDLGDLEQPLADDLERIVTEVETAEAGTQVRRRALGLTMANALDVAERLALLLPQLARLAPLAVGERDDLRLAA